MFSLDDFLSKEFLLSPKHESLFALWAARTLCIPRVQKTLLADMGPHRVESSIVDLSGIDIGEEKADLVLSFTKFINLSESLSKSMPSFNGPLSSNLNKLAGWLGLSDVERDILGFCILLESSNSMQNVTTMIGDVNTSDVIDYLTIVLDYPKAQVEYALNKNSALAQSALVKIDTNGNYEFSRKIDLIDGLIDVMFSEASSPLELMSKYFFKSVQPELTQMDFPHLKDDFELIKTYLKAIHKKKSLNKHGINVLIHGEPGTGKTQLVRVLAKILNLDLFEIASSDSDGDSIASDRRLEIFRLAQFALKQTESLILFDEVEDVFPDSSFVRLFGGKQRQSINKAWLNKLLEENPVPAFWISNHVNQIDAAYIRRFDLVIEVGNPPKSVRSKIIEQTLEHLHVSEDFKDYLSDQRDLVPAVVKRAAKVVNASNSIKKELNSQKIESNLLKLINSTHEAQGKSTIKFKSQSKVNYSLDYLHTDVDLVKLVEGIKANSRGRLCLYGMPGTGKTAFGHHLAKELDQPLILKKASDLLSPYVGEAELNITGAFKEAEREGAVLQIDEADSFLQSRENAVRSWEVTQVNELLTQMESFEGVFIASTNLMDNIDAAAMRRFDIKLEFKPMKFEQSLAMLKDYLSIKGIKEVDQDSAMNALQDLNLLTPGDFAAAMRRFEIGGQELSHLTLIAALREECQYKPGYVRSAGIGFLSDLRH